MTPRARSQRLEQLHGQLQTSLEALVTSEDWERALRVAARFHRYSFANTQLIWSQAAARGFTPTRVAGYRTWQDLGRQVRKGERGLAILAPITRTVEDEDGEKGRRVVGYRVVHVFDVSQTDGEPLPEVRAAVLEGELPAQWEKVASLIEERKFRLTVADRDLGGANGITDWEAREVVVRASLSGAQRFKTAVHELAHVSLHDPGSGERPNCRGVVEVEAESVAYVVCAALGIDSASYSLPYVATWSGGNLERVAATADRVTRCADGVLRRLGGDQELERQMTRSLPTQVRERYGVPLARETATEASGEDRPHRGLAEAVDQAVAFYRAHLTTDTGGPARRFLRERGISLKTAERWTLGYAPPVWNALVTELQRAGFTEEVILRSGVAGQARTGKLYDRMRGRLVFPVFDPEDRPRGLAGRLLEGTGPKYLNTPETPLYRKRSLLYGFHLAKEAIDERRRALVVEGYLDVIASHQAGLTQTVAAAGTALTREHLRLLGGVTKEVTLAFDGDAPGAQAAFRVGELAEEGPAYLDLRVASLPDGRDPADLVALGGADVLREAVAGAIPLAHFQIDQIVRRHNLKEPEALVRAMRQAATYVIASIPDPEARSQAVSYLADRVGRDQSAVEAALQPPAGGQVRRPEPTLAALSLGGRFR